MDDYELFVRFSQTSNNKMLVEGFVPCTYEREEEYLGGVTFWSRLHLRKLDFSNSPQFIEITRLIETSEGVDPFADNDILDDYMRDLTVVVVGVHKGTSKASLSLAQCNFGHSYARPYQRREGNGYCRSQGRMSVKSHGTVETRPIQYETCTVNVNKFCEASMKLSWSSRVQTDNNGEVPKKECLWVLDCTCIYEDEDYYGERYQRKMS